MSSFFMTCPCGEVDGHLLWVLPTPPADPLQRQLLASGTVFGGKVLANGALHCVSRRLRRREGGTDDLGHLRIPEQNQQKVSKLHAMQSCGVGLGMRLL